MIAVDSTFHSRTIVLREAVKRDDMLLLRLLDDQLVVLTRGVMVPTVSHQSMASGPSGATGDGRGWRPCPTYE